MIVRRLLAALFMGLVCTSVTFAQPEPMRWGDVPDEHLLMTEYPADPDAQAVILGDFGRADVNDRWEVTFERHRRIKLLGEGSYNLGTVSITYYAEDGTQRLDGIRGQTFVRGADGGVQRVELDRGSIFTEDLPGGRKRVKFTLPALAPGAVIEYRYTVRSKSPFLMPTWYFQDEEPLLWSEYRIQHPQDLAYTFVIQGAPEYVVEEAAEVLHPQGKRNTRRWAVANVPALRAERYMTTLEDYVQKLSIQLFEYYHPGQGAVSIVKTWDELAADLGRSNSFGRQLDPTGGIRRQAEALVAGLAEDEEKKAALYDFVRSSVVWNGSYDYGADRRLDEVLQTRRGTSGEVNVLLVALLRAAGLEAAPALVSTRGHGRVTRVYPLVTQFNHVLAAVKQGRRWELLDATDPHRPLGLLPVEAVNGQAWVVSDAPEWVDVRPGRSEHAVSVVAHLQPDGTLTGTFRSTREGYSGVAARRYLRDNPAQQYVREELMSDVVGVEVGEGVTVTGQDLLDAPLVAEAGFSVPAYAQAVGDLLLINPLLVFRHTENPFQLARRTYPVDFGAPFVSSYEIEVTLPDGYAVDEVPRDVLHRLPVNGGAYRRKVEAEGNLLRVSIDFRRSRSQFDPPQYNDLKAFYDKLVAADAEHVVLSPAVEAAGVDGPDATGSPEAAGN